MFITTSGIVLRVFPFRDKRRIIRVFTKGEGLVSFIITKNKSQIALSQPLTIAEITYKKSKNNSLFHVKDVQVEYIYRDLTLNNKKIKTSMVLCEILNKCIKEVNTELYEFVVYTFKYLDENLDVIGFDTLFLIRFCKIIGLSPFNDLGANEKNGLLSIVEGRFITNFQGINKNLLVPLKESSVLKRLSKLNFEALEQEGLTIALNKKLFHYMLLYLSSHLADLTKLKSTQVIKELG